MDKLEKPQDGGWVGPEHRPAVTSCILTSAPSVPSDFPLGDAGCWGCRRSSVLSATFCKSSCFTVNT